MSDADAADRGIVYDKASTLNPLDRVGVNIVSIAIAALIIRIIIAWVETLKKWVEATADADGVIAAEEKVCFECMMVSSWLITGIFGFILIVILVWYLAVYDPDS